MKKVCVLIATLFLLSFNIFSEELVYSCTDSACSVKSGPPIYADFTLMNDSPLFKTYKKNDKITFDKKSIKGIYGQVKNGYSDDDEVISKLSVLEDGKRISISLDYIKPVNTISLPGVAFDYSKKYKKESMMLIPEYYYSILKVNDVNSLFSYEPYWKKGYYENSNNNRYDSWKEIFYPNTLFITNSYITILRSDCDQDKVLHNISGLITKIQQINSNTYRIDFYNLISDNYLHEVDDTFKSINSKNEHFLLLKYDGDYIDVYLDSENKRINRYVISSEEVQNKILEIAKNGKTSTSNMTWPRHADGSCDYDGNKKTVASQAQKATSSTNVAPNKTMTVRENLKLRSGEDTSTQVLAVMSAGAKVRILELGKAETIDGIPSNWVKVEVQQGAKDRDGKAIKAGTVGWCFGGYME